MLKRVFTGITFALALVALDSARPNQVAAYAEVDAPAEGGGTCSIWCLSCQTHHLIAC